MKSIFQLPSLANLGHIFSWFVFLLYFLIPFIYEWEFQLGDLEVSLRMGDGNLAFNCMIGVTLGSLGALVGGYWWRVTTFLKPEKYSLRLTTLGVVTLLVTIAFVFQQRQVIDQQTSLTHVIYLVIGLGITISSLAILWLKKDNLNKITLTKESIDKWFSQFSTFNWVFFLIIFLSLLFNNIAVISKAQLPLVNSISMFVGRASFYAAATVVFCLLLEWLLRATPRRIRWIIWGMYGSVIVTIFADIVTTGFGRPLMGFVNGFTEMGILDWRQEIKGAGESYHWLANMNLLQLNAFIAGFFTITTSFTCLCWHISKRIKFKISLRLITILGVIATFIFITEQAIGTKWKTIDQRLAEQNAVQIKLNFFPAKSNDPSYSIKFIENSPETIPSGTLSKKPDIYFIMIESLRQDVISEEITPFLNDFSMKHCQSLEQTWAGSNTTYLSWYSLFHSRPPAHRKNTVEAHMKNPHTKGSPTIKWLRNHGYNIEVRAVCDLNYKSFGETNFGEPGQLAHVTEQLLPGYFYSKIETLPQREEFAFADTQLATLKNKEGGNFYYLALDSPHFTYSWHERFDPPFKDYLKNVNIPLYPSEEKVLAYKKRYWNSCAWVDHQIKGFIEFLITNNKFEDSIIVITGDHGEEFNEHGNFFHNTNLFPEQTAVPILIKWPKGTKTPAHQHASHLDIMPSILNHLGAKPDFLSELQGQSLLAKKEDHTTVIATTWAGNNGQTMVMRNNNATATFSWPNFWQNELPTDITLNSIVESGINLKLDTAEQSLTKLKELFPDAFERFIEKMEPATP